MNRARAPFAAANSASRCTTSSVIPGRTGAMISPAWTPASTSLRSAWSRAAGTVKRADHLFFDEDPRFERLPPVGAAVIGELGVGELAGVVRALDDVAMRVARIAVTAAEFAADVGIERPILHPRCGGRVEDALGCERNEPGATEALVEDGVGQSDSLTVGLQEGDLFSHNAPSRTGGTPSSRTGARSWCHNRDTEEAFEAASLGAPGVLLQPYDPE